jgi:general stress protein 26
MSAHDDPDTSKSLTELLEPGSTLMVGARAEDGDLEFRPLTVAKVTTERIEILLDTSAPWARRIGNGDAVHATMGSDRSNTWVTLTGVTSITTDPGAVDELWNPFADAYFDDGRDTAGITVLRIEPRSGAYWSTPSGRIGSLISLVKAKLGDPSDSGESGQLALRAQVPPTT